MRIELLNETHIDALAAMEQACFGKSAWSKASFLSELTSESAVFLCALEGDTLCGCAAMNDAAGQGFISKVMVAGDSRRKGIGSFLMEALIATAKERGMFELTLEVRQSNLAAIALYQKYGFETLGIRRKFYHDPEEDAVIMTKKL